jgi:dTDP-4-amino-4,6-dideoxygalactose transaminase
VTTSAAREGWHHTYQTYCIVLGDGIRLTQQEVMNGLKEVGVTTRRSCMAIHLEPYARRMFGDVALPVAERLTHRAIAIPLYPTMTDDEQAYVIEQVRLLVA